ncbi:hypothetical protein J7643_19955, partial [bacterium]|nr:hypothetical protein [bacterium]
DSLPGQPVKEKRTAASLYPAFQALLDRTEYLRNNVNADNINSGTLPAARLPAATASVFGAVKTGSNITNTAGTISIASANVIAALGYTPANRAGDTFTGKVTTAASAAGGAGFNLPHGVAPTTPGNGDIWSTSAGIFARINGATQQMLQSVGLSLPSIFTVTGSPVNAGAGTLTAALATQAANQVFAGPASGGAVAPSFRSLVVADLPTVDIAHGGTGATSKAAAFDALSPMLAIGDLIY